MKNNMDETHNNFKGLFKYISTVVSWSIFVLLIILGILLAYYYLSNRLYATKGEKYEPKFSIYTIVSESMEPTINVYDVVVNTKVDDIDDVKINDVITFISTWQVTYGMTITHRVVGTKTLDDGSTCLVTRGDNNTQEDQTCVKESELIGVVRAVVPSLGRVQFFLSSSFGWVLIVLLPALFIITKDIIKIFNMNGEIKEEEKEKNKKNKDKEKEKDKQKIEHKKEIENKNKDNIEEHKEDNHKSDEDREEEESSIQEDKHFSLEDEIEKDFNIDEDFENDYQDEENESKD